MNLNQYVQVNPEKTLAEVQAYTTYILDNADYLREYLQLNGKWRKLIAHTLDTNDILFDAASGIIHKVNKEGPISFNPHTTKGSAHVLMLDAFVAAGDLDPDDKFAVLALATKKPFENISQAEFDEAKTELLTFGETTGTMSYSVVGSSDIKVVRSNDKKLKVLFELTESVTYNTQIKLFVSQESEISGTFVELPNPVDSSIVIKAGQLNTIAEIKHNYGRWTQWRAVSNRTDAFNVLVKAVDKY